MVINNQYTRSQTKSSQPNYLCFRKKTPSKKYQKVTTVVDEPKRGTDQTNRRDEGEDERKRLQEWRSGIDKGETGMQKTSANDERKRRTETTNGKDECKRRTEANTAIGTEKKHEFLSSYRMGGP